MNKKQKELFIDELLCGLDDETFVKVKDSIEDVASSRETYYRCMIARALANYDGAFAKELLITLSNDRNTLVRTEAVDSLRFHPSCAVLDLLMEKAQNDNYYLVRAYAIYSAYAVCENMAVSKNEVYSLAKAMLDKERFVINKVFCLEVMYLCGDSDAIHEIIVYFKKSGYKNQCVVLNVLSELINDENKEIIGQFIREINVDNLSIPVAETLSLLVNIHEKLLGT